MAIEVELKFPLEGDAAGADSIIAQLEQLGATAGDRRQQRDCYYAHPARDFAETDEALRIRRDGESTRLTYKGPLLDAIAKTRRELEIEIGSGDTAAEILEALGFCPVRDVCKQRQPYALEWQGRAVEAVIDEVEGLGTFVELETMAGETDHESARDGLLALAEELGLKVSERRSYLCLLLAREG